MERSLMFMDQSNQLGENGYITKSNQMFYAIPIKIPMTLIMEIEKSTLNLARVWGKETLIHCWW
jgi:hypothetical protein